MSFKAIAWAIKQDTGDSGSKLVLIAICNYCDDMGTAFPGQEHLSRVCSMSRRSIIRHIKTLKTQGLIQIQKISNGKKVNNRYIIPMSNVTKESRQSDRLAQNTNITRRNKNFVAG